MLGRWWSWTSPGLGVRMNLIGLDRLCVLWPVGPMAGHRDTLPGLKSLSLCPRSEGVGPQLGVRKNPRQLSPQAWPPSTEREPPEGPVDTVFSRGGGVEQGGIEQGGIERGAEQNRAGGAEPWRNGGGRGQRGGGNRAGTNRTGRKRGSSTQVRLGAQVACGAPSLGSC